MSNMVGNLETKIVLNGGLFPMGTKGYSAYEVAVQQGFKGTVDEWLASLKGEKGEDGSIVFEELTEEQKEMLRGPKGNDGDAATITIGTVTTGDAGTDASVTNSGTETNAIFNFVIPKGENAIGLNNLYDGSATGSLRTINSYEEDSEYVMGRNAFSEGNGTKATGHNSHAEGYYTEASGQSSHAEGEGTKATDFYSHAEGCNTESSGESSHAEGFGSKASGNSSHAEGEYTIASSFSQHVQGKYNIEDKEDVYSHIVGNGTSNTSRSNSHTLDWNGNAWFRGDVKVGGNDYASGKTLLTEIPVASSSTLGGIKVGANLTIEEDGTLNASGGSGVSGENGATFTPSVSEDGIISWTNDRGLTNPSSVNIKGPQGPAGTPGKSATIQIGSVTTLDAGSDATVTNVGTENEAIFNFGIPKGEPGSGGEGTTDYIDLSNKPKINNVELNGNKTLDELGIQPKGTYLTSVPSVYKTKAENDALYQPKGDYASSSDIPTKTSQLTNDSGYLKGYTESDPTVPTHVKNISTTDISNWNNKSNFSGSYNDLTNKPTIPTVPTNVSSFTNDAGYLTSIPSEYVTETELNDAISGLGGGTGNVSSDIVNSIMVVDELPETEVEGVLYLVKETIENPTEPTNLWVNPTVLTGHYIDSSNGYIGTQDVAYTAYIPCETSTTYKITRTMSGYRFIIGSYSSVPKDGSTTSNFTVASSLSEVTFTTEASDNYLAIYYFGGSETLDATELLNDIVVTKES